MVSVRVRLATLATALVVGLASAACGGGDTSPNGADQADELAAKELQAVEGFGLFSPNFRDGQEIPRLFTCDGTDISPALIFEGVPEGTMELALVVDEPAGVGSNDDRTIVHWIVTGLAPDTVGLAEDRVPEGAAVARNADGVPRYEGPCPPEGDPAHSYRLTLYALDRVIDKDLDAGAAPTALDAIAARATAKTTLTATYQRNSS